MKKTYIFGHKKPDTDSVGASIALSYLNNKLGIFSEARVLDSPNEETKFALKYFNLECPRYLNDIKPEIKDTDYTKECYINTKSSILKAYNYLNEIHASAVGVVDESLNFLGIIRIKDIVEYAAFNTKQVLRTSYTNILFTLNGKEILHFDDEIYGNYSFNKFTSNSNESILIINNENYIDEINESLKLIILTNSIQISNEKLEILKNRKINVLVSPDSIHSIIKKIDLSNYVYEMTIDEGAICFKENDKIELINAKTRSYNHTDYPIIDKNNKCLGLLQLTDLNKVYKKKVYLVDHNEISQTIDGIEDAELVGVIDHHKINPFHSLKPISFINKPYGSSNSIVYEMYKENEIEIPKPIAGMMLSGILSDTLIFKSPTTTEKDIKYAKDLAKIAEVNYEQYGMNLIISGDPLNSKTVEEVLFGDFKDFTIDGKRIGVSQIITINTNKVLEEKEKYIGIMNSYVNKGDYELLLLCATDIMKEGSYILFNDSSKEILELSLGIENINQGYFLENVVSRKKQIIPKLIKYIEKR